MIVKGAQHLIGIFRMQALARLVPVATGYSQRQAGDF
jgi:hypothetical protein